MTSQPNNPLHGVTLEALLTTLVHERGWADLAAKVRIRCFARDPSISSSLKFLRRTPWARAEVERLYLWHVEQRAPRDGSPARQRAQQPLEREGQPDPHGEGEG